MSTTTRPDAVDLIGGLMGGALVAMFVMPTAIEELTAVDTSAYSSAFQAMWSVFDLVMVLAFFLGVTVMVIRASPRR